MRVTYKIFLVLSLFSIYLFNTFYIYTLHTFTYKVFIQHTTYISTCLFVDIFDEMFAEVVVTAVDFFVS